MYMTRVVFAAVAGLACVMLGFVKARALVLREDALSAWQSSLSLVRSAVSYSDDALPTILERASNGETEAEKNLARAFLLASQKMCEDKIATLEASLPSFCYANLASGDRAIILPLICRLGASERHAQLRELDGAIELLREQSARAGERTGKQKRLYSSLGSLGGLALFLFLIG